jgi:signal transduction histidine kinase
MDSNNDSNMQNVTLETDEKLDFSTVVAVAIHDMKNSLGLLMQSIEQVATQIPEENTNAREGINSVHYEANRMNTALVQVLSLYRSDLDALPVNIDECFLIDLLEEIVDTNRRYIDQKNLSVKIDVNEDLCWYLDRELIYLLVHDVLINAIRYGCSNIHISAKDIKGELHIVVADDGKGYPISMLEMATVKLSTFCISEGRTGLGLFFAKLIAQTHRNNGKSGSIKLANDIKTGGSIFELRLP